MLTCLDEEEEMSRNGAMPTGRGATVAGWLVDARRESRCVSCAL
jgi:hypothetical protein